MLNEKLPIQGKNMPASPATPYKKGMTYLYIALVLVIVHFFIRTVSA